MTKKSCPFLRSNSLYENGHVHTVLIKKCVQLACKNLDQKVPAQPPKKHNKYLAFLKDSVANLVAEKWMSSTVSNGSGQNKARKMHCNINKRDQIGDTLKEFLSRMMKKNKFN